MREDYLIPQGRKRVENVAILAVIFLAVCVVIAAGCHFAGMEKFVFGTLEVGHTMKVFLAIVILLASWKLYQRHHLAWVVSILLLLSGMTVSLLAIREPFHEALLMLEALILLVLIFCRKDFCRRGVRGKIGKLTAQEREEVLELVRQYGQNPGAYLTLEEDKTIFFGDKVRGVVPYGIIGDVVVVNGDPICAPEDFETLLLEFKAFCHTNIYSCVFLSVTETFLPVYKANGYGRLKCGEEPRFDVQNYSLKGGKIANVRAEINHAIKDQVQVLEYRSQEKREPVIEKDFDRITQEWMQGKKTGGLGFTLGGVDFQNPLDKRFFYALDRDGNMVGFIIYVPFDGMNGYMADVTRRGKNAPRGIMEFINYQAILQFKEEGIQWLSMGLAPLARMDEGEDKDELGNRLLGYIYQHLNKIYGFKDLYKAKEKYNPAMWVPGYFVFDPKFITLDIAYAVVAIQNPQGVMDYIKAYFRP